MSGYFPIGYFFTGYFPEDWWPDQIFSGGIDGSGEAVSPATIASARGMILEPVSYSGMIFRAPPMPIRGVGRGVTPASFGLAEGAIGVAGSGMATVAVSAAGAGTAYRRIIGKANAPLPRCGGIAYAAIGVEGTGTAQVQPISAKAEGRYDMFSDKDMEEIAAFLMVA